MNFGAAWSTGTNRPRLEYSADVRTRSPARGLLYIAYSGMDTVKYFGLGNETPRDSALQSAGFYNVRQGVFVANPQIEVPFVGPLHARVGVLFKHASSVDDSRILATTRPEGSGGMTPGSGEVGVRIDTRARSLTPPNGIHLHANGR